MSCADDCEKVATGRQRMVRSNAAWNISFILASISESLPSPLQLVSQNIEIITVRRLHQIECCAAFSDADAVAGVERVADLAVEGEDDAFVLVEKFHLDHRRVGNDDR